MRTGYTRSVPSGKTPAVLAQRELAARVADREDSGVHEAMRTVWYRMSRMAKERPVDALMKKLVQAVEASLAATEAARDAVQEILKRGADTGIFFAGSKSRGSFTAELTPQDKEFLRAVSIKPER